MGWSDRTSSWLHAGTALTVLLVAACGGPLPATTVTVEGRVQAVAGLPMAGVVVRSQGKTTVTGADGGFTLAGLTTPYAVSLSADAPNPWMHVFDGLTTTEPSLIPYAGYFLPLLPAGAYQRTQVYGPVPADANPIPASQRLVVCVEGLTFDVLGCATVTSGATSYAFEAVWAVPGNAPVRLHALRMQVDVNGRPTGYLSHATQDLTLTPGVDAVQAAPAGLPIFGIGLQATVGAAGGGTLVGAVVAARVSPRLSLPVFQGPAAGGAVELVVPSFAIDDCSVLALATFPGGSSFAWQVGAVLDGFAVVAPAPPQLLAPPDAATGVTTETGFEAVGGPGGARTFRWSPEVGQDGPVVALTTPDESVTIPDPADVGLPLPAGGAYLWNVIATAVADVDALAQPAFGEFLRFVSLVGEGGGGPGFTQDGAYVLRATRAFTLAP